MRKIYFFIALFIVSYSNAQIVNIPDANFKNALLNSGIDVNSDAEIQVSEALMLQTLWASNENISNLEGIENFPNLTLLSVSSNSLTSIDVSELTNLAYLYCDGNLLSSLHVSYLNNLVRLECDNNLLTSLELDHLPELEFLSYSSNPITNISFDSTLPRLKYMYCVNTHLTSLDISALAGLNQLSFYSNMYMTHLNIKNGFLNANFTNFSGNWATQYVCCDTNQVPLIQTKLTQYGLTFAHVNSYCSFVPGGEFYTIQGNGKYDYNGNGCDSGDVNFSGLTLNISNGSSSGGTLLNQQGDYTLPLQAGNYTVSTVLENPSYFLVAPSSINVGFPTQSSPVVQNFCVTANGVHNDLEIILLPVSPARPGFNAKYKIVYRNKGTNAQSGTINVSFEDNLMDFVSSSLPANQSVNLLSWNYTNLLPLESETIDLVFNINSPTETPAVTIGDQLDFVANITPLAGDEIPFDNSGDLKQIVVGAIDPNDKTCLEGTTITPSMVSQYIHYIIRFENTGTFAAENIVVKDMIDTTKFDISTMIPMGSSHSFVTRISNTNQLEFIFENINLPFDDANNDGYVAFKIKTKPTLVIGDSFSNTANIYFDYNFPIVTNTATTNVVALGQADFDFAGYFTLSPNPAKDILNIKSSEPRSISSLSIYNNLGQLVLTVTKPQNSIDVSGLKTGSYFIKVFSDKGSATSKFIKE